MKGFEEKLKHLEEINEKLKNRELGLDESIELYEEGIQLSKELEKQLKKAEKKIEILVNSPENPQKDKAELELFDSSEDGSTL